MPFYLSKDRENEERLQMEGWTEMAAYLRSADPYGRPVPIHPSGPGSSRDDVVDTSDLDFMMLQTGHADRVSLPDTLRVVAEEYAAEPVRPVINGEVTYEGLAESNRQEIQRWMFWACVLGGAAGHSYGANGIWQVNHRVVPYGKSPGGQSWGDTAWDGRLRPPRLEASWACRSGSWRGTPGGSCGPDQTGSSVRRHRTSRTEPTPRAHRESCASSTCPARFRPAA